MILPTKDGQDVTYDWRSSDFNDRNIDSGREYVLIAPHPGAANEKLHRSPRTGRYKVVFINGILGNPLKLAHQALTVSAVSGGPVTAFYNKSGGFLRDMGQVWSDKWTSTMLMKARASVGRAVGVDPARDMFDALNNYNKATANLYEWLLANDSQMTKIVGHSQGCLIAANAVNALVATRGRSALENVEIFALGSPVTFWSDASSVMKRFSFTNDIVAWTSLHPGLTNKAYARGFSTIESEHDSSERVVGYQRAAIYKLHEQLTHSAYLYLHDFYYQLKPKFP